MLRLVQTSGWNLQPIDVGPDRLRLYEVDSVLKLVRD